MDSDFNLRPSPGSKIWSGAFLLFSALVAGIAASFLIRRGRSSALLIALVVAIAFLLLEWPLAAMNTEGLAERVTSRKSWFAIALVATVTCAAYLPTLRVYFLADDFGDVQLYSHPSFGTFLRLFAMDQSQGTWGYLTQEFRPLVGLSYMLDYSLWGTNSVGYHLTAVLLHVVSSLAIFAIAKKAAALTNWGAALAGLLFALLPVHPESVAWINGSKVDALPSMCYLVGFLGFVSYRATGQARHTILAAAGFVSSLMSKEIAVTFPAMLISFDVVRWASRTPGISPDSATSRTASWRAVLFPYLLIGGLFLAYLVVRDAIFPSVLREDRLPFSFREAFASLAGFRVQIGRLWPEFKGLQVYSLEQFLSLSPWSVGMVLGLTLAWTVFIVRAGARRGMVSVIFFGGAWYAIACLPLLVTYHSARHLYLPMAGPSIALACLASSGWTLLSSRARVVRVAGSVALVSILAVFLWTQINNWVHAGEISNKLEKGVVAALEVTPKDALVIAWAPYGISPSGWAPPWVWPWVMPFALQKPFVGHDLYSASPRLVEFPDMYCCPVGQWWERKRPVLLSVLSGEPEELVDIRRLAWDEQNGVVSRLRVAVPRKQLRALIEEALGEPVEDAKTVSHDTAIKLMTALMDLTAQRH